MAKDAKSLLKMGCLGCGGVVGVVVLVFAVLAAVARSQVSGEELAQATLSHELPENVGAATVPGEIDAVARVLLDIKDAEVYLKRGLPGQPPTVEASYDERYFRPNIVAPPELLLFEVLGDAARH